MIPKKIVVLGPPLSGKGTQGIKLAEKLNYKIFSPGDIFREEIKNKTNLGKKIIHIINNGYLVDDKIVNETMEKRIRNVNSYVLDGYPRTIAQAYFLNELVSRTKEKIDLVIIINIDKKESIKRAKDRSRDDDKSIDILNTRWEEYYSKTIPVIDYYKNMDNMVLEINGIGIISEIEKEIHTKIKNLK